MSKNPVAPAYLSMKDMAERTGVTTRTLQNWKLIGMPYVKVRGTVRIKISDFDNWMDGRKVTEQSPPPKEIIDQTWRELMKEVVDD